MKPIGKSLPRIQKTHDEDILYSLQKVTKKNLRLRNKLQHIYLEVYLAKLKANQGRNTRRDWMFFFLIFMILITLIFRWFGIEELGAISSA